MMLTSLEHLAIGLRQAPINIDRPSNHSNMQNIAEDGIVIVVVECDPDQAIGSLSEMSVVAGRLSLRGDALSARGCGVRVPPGMWWELALRNLQQGDAI
jgi:hypothetical protein